MVQQLYSALARGEKKSCIFFYKHHYDDFVDRTRCGSPFVTHHTAPFKIFISFYCGDTRTPIVSWEQRIALLDEHSHAAVFPIIWPVVILWRCSTGWKLLKSKVLGEGGGQIHGHYFFNPRPQPGLIWYGSQSWKQILALAEINTSSSYFLCFTGLPVAPLSLSLNPSLAL